MTSDGQLNFRRTPGVPGAFGDLQWVDTPDFGEDADQRRIPRVYDLDPAPLAKLLATFLGLAEGDLGTRMREIANDDRNGPIHIVHLLGACEYAAKNTGGGMPGSAGPRGDTATELLTMASVGDALHGLVDALREGGFPAATAAARAMDAETRYRIVDSLLSYWAAPITALRIDLTDEQFQRR